jgi:hypothetical protein
MICKDCQKEIFGDEPLVPEGKYKTYTEEAEGRDWESFDKAFLITMLRVKSNTIDIFKARWLTARKTIENIARTVDVDPKTTGYEIYLDGEDGGSGFLCERIKSYFDTRGDKVKMKRQIEELEKEVEYLRRALRGAR